MKLTKTAENDYTVSNLNIDQLSLISKLMSMVRLGGDSKPSQAAYEIISAIHDADDESAVEAAEDNISIDFTLEDSMTGQTLATFTGRCVTIETGNYLDDLEDLNDDETINLSYDNKLEVFLGKIVTLTKEPVTVDGKTFMWTVVSDRAFEKQLEEAGITKYEFILDPEHEPNFDADVAKFLIDEDGVVFDAFY